MYEEEKGKKEKIGAVIVVAILLIGSIVGALIYLNGMDRNNSDDEGSGNPDDGSGPDNLQTQDQNEYVGTIIPASYLGSSQTKSLVKATTGETYYFVGYNKSDPAKKTLTFEVGSNVSVSAITGGEFKIVVQNGQHVIENMNTTTEDISVDDLNTYMQDSFKNIEVSFTSLSLTYGDWTLGIGTTGTNDYIWVAPNRTYSTFFTDVNVKGVSFNKDALSALKGNLNGTVFDNMDISGITSLASKFGFDFSGSMQDFLIVTNLTYNQPVSVIGDVIDTIQPSDINRLADSFSNNGTGWIKSIVRNVSMGVSIVAESNNTLDDNTLWFLLYDTNKFQTFPGICHLNVYESNINNLTQRIPSLDTSSFNLNFNFSFDIRVGILNSMEQATYAQSDVKTLWDDLNTSHSETMVKSVDLKGFGLVVDLKTLLESLEEAFNVDKSEADMVNKLTTFRNPAFVIMLDRNLPNMLKDNGTEMWKYASIAILSDYDIHNSAVRYLDIKGIVYDPATYFNIDSSLSHIPIVVADSYSEITDNLQRVTVKDLKNGNVQMNSDGWAYVQIDSITTGTTMKKLAENLPNQGTGKVLRTAIKAMPVDAGVYDGIQTVSLNETYEVPIIYFAAGHGPTYYDLNITRLRGMYIGVKANFSGINEVLQGNINWTGPSISPTLEAILPSNITEPITNFTKNILSNGLTPSGYILAFSLEEIENAPPTIIISAPTENSTLTAKEFNISFSGSDNPDMVMWVELNVTQHTLLGDIPLNGIPLSIIGNGNWSTGNLWWWSDIQKYVVENMGIGDYTITLRAHDLHGYGESVSVSFQIGG